MQIPGKEGWSWGVGSVWNPSKLPFAASNRLTESTGCSQTQQTMKCLESCVQRRLTLPCIFLGPWSSAITFPQTTKVWTLSWCWKGRNNALLPTKKGHGDVSESDQTQTDLVSQLLSQPLQDIQLSWRTPPGWAGSAHSSSRNPWGLPTYGHSAPGRRVLSWSQHLPVSWSGYSGMWNVLFLGADRHPLSPERIQLSVVRNSSTSTPTWALAGAGGGTQGQWHCGGFPLVLASALPPAKELVSCGMKREKKGKNRGERDKRGERERGKEGERKTRNKEKGRREDEGGRERTKREGIKLVGFWSGSLINLGLGAV